MSTTMVCWMMLAFGAQRAVDSFKGAVENLQFELRAARLRRLDGGRADVSDGKGGVRAGHQGCDRLPPRPQAQTLDGADDGREPCGNQIYNSGGARVFFVTPSMKPLTSQNLL